jgi:hypothetical protein
MKGKDSMSKSPLLLPIKEDKTLVILSPRSEDLGKENLS